MASKFKKKDKKKTIKEETMDQVKKDAKKLYPVSDADVKRLEEAAKGDTTINNMALIKALKKRFDKVKD
jgi:hypothetical protein|tara:strand:- start:701 stop:907 length:207 start_codon:yes stop_codon:yes gene_type:complete